MKSKRERRLTDWAQERADFNQAWIYAEVPPEFGVFFDWCSLCQPPVEGGMRSVNEELSIHAALQDIDLWCARMLLMRPLTELT